LGAHQQTALANGGGVADLYPLPGAVQQAERDGVVGLGGVFGVFRENLSRQGLDELEFEVLPVPSGAEGRVDALENGTFGAALAQ